MSANYSTQIYGSAEGTNFIFEADNSRKYFYIENNHATLPIDVGFGTDATASDVLTIAAGDFFEPIESPAGEIHVTIDAGGGTFLLITENHNHVAS